MNSVRNVIVVGSGPAGYTAALYLARAELKPVVLAGEKWGGQLMLTTEVENYPGFVEGIMGPKLMEVFREQAKRFGAEVIDKNVSWVDFSSRPFKVGVGEKPGIDRSREKLINMDRHSEKQDLSTNINRLSTVYQARSVIIATGAESRLIGVPGEKEFMGRGVSTCAVCDAPLYKGKAQTFVVGGGDAATEEALALAKYASNVTVIHRRDSLKASKIMQRRVQATKNIDFMWNSEVVEVMGENNKLSKIKIKNNKTNEIVERTLDGLFVAIGHTPATEVFRGQVLLDHKGYLMTGLNGLVNGKGRSHKAPRKEFSTSSSFDKLRTLDSEIQRGRQKTTEGTEGFDEGLWLEGYPTMTSVEGVFGAGDVVDFRYRQAVTAAGFGCMAALDVEKWLGSQGVEVGGTAQY